MSSKAFSGVVSILLVTLFILNSQYGVFNKVGSIIGFETLSLQKIYYDSTGEEWVAVIVASKSSNELYGDFDKSDFENAGAIMSYPERDFSVSLSLDSQTCNYPIKVNTAAVDLYLMGYEYKSFGILTKDSTIESWCIDVSNGLKAGYAYRQRDFLNLDAFCYYYTKEGTVGKLQTPLMNFDATFKVKVGTDEQTASINNRDSSVVEITNRFKANWVGSLTSGETCPSSSAEDVIMIYYSGTKAIGKGWSLRNQEIYNTYVSYYNNGFDICLNNFKSKSAEFLDCVYNFNIREDNAVKKYKDFDLYQTDVYQRSNINSGQVVVELPELFTFPQFVLKIDADWVGVYAPSGVPRIIGASSTLFKVGQTGYVQADIKNVGDADAVFSVGLVCNSPFSPASGGQELNFRKGETRSVSLPINAVGSEDVSNFCSVKATDTVNPGNFDTKTVSVSASPIQVCNPGFKTCNGVAIDVCNSAGSGWERVSICDYHCSNLGGSHCVEKDEEIIDDSPGGSFSLSAWFDGLKNKFSSPIAKLGLYTLVGIIIGLVLLGLGFIIGTKMGWI